MGLKAGRLLLVTTIAGCAWACQAPRPAPNVADPDPQVKIAGMKQAVANKDRSVLPKLVESLESDDPAVRFFAIRSLEQFAGDRLGYEYYADDDERKPAVARWQSWLKGQDVPVRAAQDK
jgi:hypothetical protein